MEAKYKTSVRGLHLTKVLKTWLTICYRHIAKYYRSFGIRIVSTWNGNEGTFVITTHEDDAKEKVLSKSVRAKGNVVPVIFVYFVCNLYGHRCNIL